MEFDWNGYEKLYFSSHYRKNTVSGNKNEADFAEMVNEMRRADKNSDELSGKLGEEYEREREQRKLDGPTDAEIRQMARERAIKLKKLLQYRQFLMETSIKRADEELEMIKYNEKKLNNARYKNKTVYLAVSCAGGVTDNDEDIFSIIS